MDLHGPKPNVAAPAANEPARRTSGIVVPQPLPWHRATLASLIYGLIEGVAATLRYRWEYHPEVLRGKRRPVIFATWHNRLSISLLMYRDYVRRIGQPARMAAIVSASRDGGVVARILEHFGVQPVRGSSSRRGPQALLELTTWSERGYDLAITPDGPRGPRYVIQPGAIALAQLTGCPVIPSCYRAHWKVCLRSWDRFQIPLPFSRVDMRFGEPLFVPRDASEGERERLRLALEERLLAMTAD
jgi:hypothetical protein